MHIVSKARQQAPVTAAVHHSPPRRGIGLSVGLPVLLVLLLLCGPMPARAQGAEAAQAAQAAQEARTPETTGAAAAAVADPSHVAQELARATDDDARIATRVAARLARQDRLRDVSVAVNGGVVTLTGTVLEDADRELAQSMSTSVEGVVEVQQRIAIDASLRERVQPALEQAQLKLLRLVGALPLLFVAAGVVLAFAWLGRWLAGRLHLLRWGSANPYLDSLLRRGVRLAALLIGVLIALDLLGATALVGAVLGSAGVLGIMLGFAFRDIAENQLAGLLLSLRRPFEPGDHIMLDGHEGKVISLNARATVLMTMDGNHLRLPNAMVFKGVLLNYTRNPMRRLQFTLGVGTAEELTAVQALGVRTLKNIPAIAIEPEPRATIQSVGDSSVLIDFSAWIDQRQVDFAMTRSEAIRQVKCAIEDAGMDMPEPIYRVQLTHCTPETQAPAAAQATDGAVPRVRPPKALAAAPPDVSVNHDVDRQVARERATPEGQDLLRHPAPKE
jgi:small-conductance mechanosensitive channel